MISLSLCAKSRRHSLPAPRRRPLGSSSGAGAAAWPPRRASLLALACAIAVSCALLQSLCVDSLGSPLAPTCLKLWAQLAAMGAPVPPLRCPGPAAAVAAATTAPPPRGAILVRYAGRSGNQLLQHMALRFVGARLGWAVLAPPGELGDFGLAVGSEEMCPRGVELPWSWLYNAPVLRGDLGQVRDFRLRLHRLAADASAPRALFSDFYWEHADVLMAAVAHATGWQRESKPHPWLPSSLRRVYSRFLDGGSGDDGASWPPPSHPLLLDAEGTIVLHVRLDDLVRYSLQQSFMRAQQQLLLLPAAAAGDVERARGEWRGRVDAPAPDDFAAALALAASADTLPTLAAARGLPPLLEQLEDNASLDMIVAIPLSYYRAVLRGARARRVLVVTDAGSVSHPLVRALVDEFNATVQARSVVEDMATLMAARALVATPSTFAMAAALLGRAATVHWPHAGAGALAKSWQSCLFPAPSAAAGGEQRFVLHDVLRAAVLRIAATEPAAAARMQREHGWRQGDLEACLERHPAGSYFLTPRQLLDFYRDEGCARVFLPRAVAADGRVRLCTDEFEEDWATLMSVQEGGARLRQGGLLRKMDSTGLLKGGSD